MDINNSEILLSDSLYTEYEIGNWTFEQILSLLYYSERNKIPNNTKTIDSFCPLCMKETTFISRESNQQEFINVTVTAGYVSNGKGTIEKLIDELQKIGNFQREFYCPRPESNKGHDHIVLFKLSGSKLIKIGQSPSIADLSRKEIEKYRLLNDNIYFELNRAIGLASHGIGVGSFVYLRRIIEKHLVYPAIEKLKNDKMLPPIEIDNLDFKSKIELAKDFLPDFLVNNRKIYSILSKGVHELEEKECLKFFNILRTSIEIILDEELEKIEKEKKAKLIKKELDDIK